MLELSFTSLTDYMGRLQSISIQRCQPPYWILPPATNNDTITKHDPNQSDPPNQPQDHPINHPPHNLQQKTNHSPHLLNNHQENDRNPHNTRVFGQGHCIPTIQVINNPIHHHQPPHHQHYYHHHCPT